MNLDDFESHFISTLNSDPCVVTFTCEVATALDLSSLNGTAGPFALIVC